MVNKRDGKSGFFTLSKILNSLNDGVMFLDRDFTIIDCNQQMLHITRKEKTEDLIGRKCHELLHGSDRNINGCPFHASLQSGKREQMDLQFEDRHYRVTSDPVKESGSVIGTIHILTDVTEQKQREDQLIVADLVLQHMSEAVHLVRLSDGVIIYSNPKFDEMFGFSTGEVIGKHVSVLNANSKSGNSQDKVNEITGILMKEGKWSGEIENVRKDGALFWCYAYVERFQHPEFGETALSVHLDITEQLKADERLLASEALLRETQKISGVGGWEWNIEKGDAIWTDEVYRIYNVPRSFDTRDLDMHLSFYDDGDREELALAFQKSLEEGKPYDMIVGITDGKGEHKIVRTIGKPVKDESGQIVKIRGNFIDVSSQVETEMKILESEQYVRSIYESADNVAFVVTDLGGKNTRILDFSSGAEKIFGLKKENMIGEKVSKLHPPGADEEFEAMQEKLRSRRKGFSGETTLLRNGDEEFPALFTIHPRFDSEGSVIGTIGTSIDISYLKEAETELQNALANVEMANIVNETLLNGARMILGEDSFGKTARKLFDYCRELTGAQSGYVALLSEDGMENEVLFLEAGGMPCTVDPDLPMPIRGLRAEAYRSGNVVFDNDFMNSQWTEFMPEGHVHLKNVMFVPLTISGKTVGIIGLANKKGNFSVEDIRIASSFGELASVALQKSRFLDELKTARDRAQNYLDVAGVMILTLDKDGKITMVNRKGIEILGKESEQLIGENWFDNYLPKTEVQEVKHVFRELMKGNDESFAEYEGPILNSKGVERVISWHNAVLRDNFGNIIGTLSSGLDITDKIDAENEKEHVQQQLLQSQKMEAIGSLAGGIAHDFNNILTAINGYCQLILPQLENQPLITHDIKEIRKSAERAASMTRQLLAFSRRQVMRPQILAVNDVIKDMEKMLRRLIGENIKLRIQPTELLPNIKSDRSQLEQVILNLAVNARDAMPNGGELWIMTDYCNITDEDATRISDGYPGEFVRITIRDNGEGISPEVVPHIFEPFFTTKELGEGTGLGLSTVYGIITQQEGLIHVESEEGKGTMFNIYFPVVKEKSLSDDDKQKEHAEFSGEGQRILLVEDEKSARDVGVRILHLYGYKVQEAESAEKALELFESSDGEFDLLFTDIVLPGMNGLDLASELRSRKPNLPVLLCSGYTDKKVQVEEILEKNFRFLQKPYDIDELLQIVQEIILKRKDT